MGVYKIYIIIVLSLTALAGCMQSRRSNNTEIFAQAAQTAIEGGDWATARKQWALASEAAAEGRVPEDEMASIYFEYGRAAGATCMYQLAIDNFKRAYELELDAKGPAYLAQAELGRLEISREQYGSALRYLEKALCLYGGSAGSASATATLATIKMDYARTLEALGQIEAADAARMEVYKLRELDSRTEKAVTYESTPYGQFCLN